MLEFIKSCLVDFILFSAIEGFIFCLFFEKIGGCKKFKWYEWLILSIGNCLISKIFPPLIYQFICIIYMSIILYKINKIKILKCFSLSFKCVFIIFTIEIVYSFILENSIDINGLKLYLNIFEKLSMFILMIPIRILEFYIVLNRKGVLK